MHPSLPDSEGSQQEPHAPLTPTTFTSFGKLPAEIRLEIYQIALRSERQVRLLARKKVARQLNNVVAHTIWRREFNTAPSALLHVNSESRMEALEYLPSRFPSRTALNGHPALLDTSIRGFPCLLQS